MAGEPDQFRVGRFPVWIYLGLGKNNTFYGLPQFGYDGIKLAQHITVERTDVPNPVELGTDASISGLKQFLGHHFRHRIQRFYQAEHCLYTNTETEDYLIDFYPQKSNVVVGAGFSGHGFKLAPLTGRILAELLINQKTTVSVFESERLTKRFNWRE